VIDKTKENILAGVLALAIISHFGVAYFLWRWLPIDRIYYLTLYMNMDVWGLAVFVLTRESKWLRGIGMLGMAIGSFYLYIEFRGNPTKWTPINFVTIIIILINTCFIWHFSDKIKNKKNE